MAKRVVMADVAREAGVSSQTVSRVLSGKGSVSPTTRERVMAAVNHLGYRIDLAARTLASGASSSLGVLIMGRLSYGRMRSFVALERAQRERGRHTIPVTTNPYSHDEAAAGIDYLHDAAVAALVIMGQEIPTLHDLVEKTEVPTVAAVNRHLGVPVISQIYVDQVAGTLDILRHLYGLGCRNIWYVGPNNDDADAYLRRTTYSDFCGRHGLDSVIIPTRDWGCDDGERAGEILGHRGKPHAIVAGNDEIAIGLMASLDNRYGWKAGRDYAITGFDDLAVAKYQRPALSTVFQDNMALSRAISDEIDYRLNGGEPRHKTLRPVFRPRASTLLFHL